MQTTTTTVICGSRPRCSPDQPPPRDPQLKLCTMMGRVSGTDAPVQDARCLVGDLGVKPLIARRGTEHGSGLAPNAES